MSQKKLFSLNSPLTQYFILAIALTWIFWIPTIFIAVSRNYFLPSILTFTQLFEEGFVDNFHVLIFIVNQIGVYGPMIAAFIILGKTRKKEGIVNLLKSMISWKVSIKWYGAIILLPLIITLASAGISFLYGADLSKIFNPGISAFYIVLMFINTILTSGLEEPGWRGYALPSLQEKYSANKSSIILGFIWSIWHYPFIIYLYLTQLNFGIFLSIVSVIGFTASTVGGTILFTWIYNNTNSVFLLIFFHGLMNFIPQIVMGGVTDSTGGVITALITWGIAILLVRLFGEQTLVKLTEEEIKARQEKKERKKKK